MNNRKLTLAWLAAWALFIAGSVLCIQQLIQSKDAYKKIERKQNDFNALIELEKEQFHARERSAKAQLKNAGKGSSFENLVKAKLSGHDPQIKLSRNEIGDEWLEESADLYVKDASWEMIYGLIKTGENDLQPAWKLLSIELSGTKKPKVLNGRLRFVKISKL